MSIQQGAHRPTRPPCRPAPDRSRRSCRTRMGGAFPGTRHPGRETRHRPATRQHHRHDPHVLRSQSILTRWKKSDLCDPADILILHAQSDIAKSPLGDRRVLAGRNLRECTEPISAFQNFSISAFILHTSIHKVGADGPMLRARLRRAGSAAPNSPPGRDANGSKTTKREAPPKHRNTETPKHRSLSWFMAVSRARQLLAVVESGKESAPAVT